MDVSPPPRSTTEAAPEELWTPGHQEQLKRVAVFLLGVVAVVMLVNAGVTVKEIQMTSEGDLFRDSENTLCRAGGTGSLAGSDVCRQSHRKKTFIWIFLDGYPLQHIKKFYEVAKDHADLSLVRIYGDTFSNPMYFSYFTGKYPSGFEAKEIISDNLFRQFNANGMSVSYMGSAMTVGQLLPYDGPTFHQHTLVEDDAHKDLFGETLFTAKDDVLTYQELCDRLDEHMVVDDKGVRRSLLLKTGLLDKMGHKYLKMDAPSILETVDRFIASLLLVKQWVDAHPDTVLVLTSDHGMQNDPFRTHGVPDGDNIPFVMVYNPDITPDPDAQLQYIDSMDVAPTLVQYLDADIPFESIGLAKINNKEVAEARRVGLYRNALQIREYATKKGLKKITPFGPSATEAELRSFIVSMKDPLILAHGVSFVRLSILYGVSLLCFMAMTKPILAAAIQIYRTNLVALKRSYTVGISILVFYCIHDFFWGHFHHPGALSQLSLCWIMPLTVALGGWMPHDFLLILATVLIWLMSFMQVPSLYDERNPLRGILEFPELGTCLMLLWLPWHLRQESFLMSFFTENRSARSRERSHSNGERGLRGLTAEESPLEGPQMFERAYYFLTLMAYLYARTGVSPFVWVVYVSVLCLTVYSVVYQVASKELPVVFLLWVLSNGEETAILAVFVVCCEIVCWNTRAYAVRFFDAPLNVALVTAFMFQFSLLCFKMLGLEFDYNVRPRVALVGFATWENRPMQALAMMVFHKFGLFIVGMFYLSSSFGALRHRMQLCFVLASKAALYQGMFYYKFTTSHPAAYKTLSIFGMVVAILAIMVIVDALVLSTRSDKRSRKLSEDHRPSRD